MYNTGTWNSDLACIFFLCLLAPICWYFLVAAIETHAAISAQKCTKPQAAKKQSPPKSSKPMEINVSLNFPNLKGWSQQKQPKASKKPKKVVSKPKSKEKHQSKAKPNTQKPLTSSVFQNEAVLTLSRLGYKKSEASKIVRDVSSKKEYRSTESLVKACFMCI